MDTKPKVKLHTGAEMPLVGLGTWKSEPGKVADAVRVAIDAGYRHIDCAAAYGNEKEVGTALKEKLGGVCERKDLWVTSKLWNTKHAPEDVLPALKQSLSDLKLDQLDLYLMHWPTGFAKSDQIIPRNEDGTVGYSDVHFLDTWKAMEECVTQGLTRHIGMSNFNLKQMEEVYNSAKIKPAVNQVELHPYLTQPELVKWCQEKGVQVTAYSPLGSRDRPWAKPGDPDLFEDETVKAIAGKHGKSPAQVLIRFHMEKKCVVIPKSVTKERIIANFDVFGFQLSAEEMAALDGLDRKWRACLPCVVVDGKDVPRDRNHPFYPFVPY